MELWQNMFATHVMGPVALTKALLPCHAGGGAGPHRAGVERGRGARACRASQPYSAAKGALERWGESMAGEIAPFGLGVTVLVAGMYDTDIITDAGTTDDRDFDGPYARLHNTINKRGRFAMRIASPPAKFARRPRQGAGRHAAPYAKHPRRARCPMLLAVQPDAAAGGDVSHESRSRWESRGKVRCATAPPR